MSALTTTKHGPHSAASSPGNPNAMVLAPQQPMTVQTPGDHFISSMLARPILRPRDHDRVLIAIRQEANAAAEKFFYEFPVTDRKSGKKSIIRGPSIKCANAINRIFGNCGYGTEVVDGGDCWLFLATFVDAETGSVAQRAYRQRKGEAKMGSDSQRQEDMTFQIGQSKAIRNVIVNALSTYVDFAMDNARSGLLEAVGKNLGKYKEKALTRLGELDVPIDRVTKWIGRGPDQWDAKDLTQVVAALQGISEGLASANDIWPDPQGPVPSADGPTIDPEGQPAEKPEAPPPAARKPAPQKKAPAAAKPSAEPAQFSAERVIAAFESARTSADLDDIWAKHETAIGELPADEEEKVINAYNARSDALQG